MGCSSCGKQPLAVAHHNSNNPSFRSGTQLTVTTTLSFFAVMSFPVTVAPERTWGRVSQMRAGQRSPSVPLRLRLRLRLSYAA
jgi:hypothetical protein